MATIQILTQYYENYGFHEGTERWKPKGGFDFVVEVESDALMYVNNLEELLAQMVAEESTQLERFEYLEHSVSFSQPHKLSTERLEQLIVKQGR